MIPCFYIAQFGMVLKFASPGSQETSRSATLPVLTNFNLRLCHRISLHIIPSMPRVRPLTPRKGIAIIRSFHIDGFEEPFMIDDGKHIRNWEVKLRMQLKLRAAELRELAAKRTREQFPRSDPGKKVQWEMLLRSPPLPPEPETCDNVKYGEN
jgi:hypothetical protein